MKAFFTRTPTGFAPADEDAQRYWNRFQIDDVVQCTFTRPRSLEQLRFYWALMKIVYENTEQFRSAEEVSDSVKLACGLCDTVHVKYKGEWYERKVPKSIAFENMEQDAFTAFVDKALTYICTELMPGLDPQTLETEARAA